MAKFKNISARVVGVNKPTGIEFVAPKATFEADEAEVAHKLSRGYIELVKEPVAAEAPKAKKPAKDEG